MDRHFGCTACGKCCHGWLPLTIADALAHAHRFPLAVIWTPVRQGSKSFALIARLGTTVKLKKNSAVAVRISPTAYMPASFPCTVLTDDGLCGIHEEKPSRCRAMPFSPYHNEEHQSELLVPRKDWACDTTDAAPLVYRDNKIVERADFERELSQIVAEADTLKAYAHWMIESVPGVLDQLTAAALKPMGGNLILNFTTLLPRLRGVDVIEHARRQLPLMKDFGARTSRIPSLSQYHKFYRDSVAEMERVLARAAGGT